MDNLCCDKVRINGIVCHETGCPDNWRGLTRKCQWCGEYFTTEERFQKCCSHSCTVIYDGASCDCSECREDFGYLNGANN